MSDAGNESVDRERICPECGSDQTMYGFTAGDLGLQARKCLDCGYGYWWNGERVVEDRQVMAGGSAGTHDNEGSP